MLTLISEIGINHNGVFKNIEELIRQSAFGGADVAKFQLYDSMRVFGDESRKRNEFTFEQVRYIKDVCDAYSIEFLASVFDMQKVEWCESLGINRYKLASRTVAKDIELCNQVVQIGKPVIASLGMWHHAERLPFDEPNVSYLNCIFSYPARLKDLQYFIYDNRVVGLSDHSYGISHVLYAIAHGAKVIEKHFTMDKSMDGNDHIGSMNSEELRYISSYGRELACVHSAIHQRPM